MYLPQNGDSASAYSTHDLQQLFLRKAGPAMTKQGQGASQPRSSLAV